MSIKLFDFLRHRLLGRPFELSVHHTSHRRHGPVVVLLHGIGASGGVWDEFIRSQPSNQYKFVALDLLGFGESPKPDYIAYSVEDHARSVVHTLKKLKYRKFILVGHSMGALIGAEIASKNPKKVTKLVCVGMPLYDKNIDRRSSLFAKLYRYIVAHSEKTYPIIAGYIKKSGVSLGLDLRAQSYIPFRRSLEQVIINQRTYRQLLITSTPTVLIAGRLDPFVLLREYKAIITKNQCVTERLVATSAHMLDASIYKYVASALVD